MGWCNLANFELINGGEPSFDSPTLLLSTLFDENWELFLISFAISRFTKGNLSDAKASQDAFTPNLQQSAEDNGSGGKGRGKKKKRVNKNLLSNEFLTTDSETMTGKIYL